MFSVAHTCFYCGRMTYSVAIEKTCRCVSRIVSDANMLRNDGSHMSDYEMSTVRESVCVKNPRSSASCAQNHSGDPPQPAEMHEWLPPVRLVLACSAPGTQRPLKESSETWASTRSKILSSMCKSELEWSGLERVSESLRVRRTSAVSTTKCPQCPRRKMPLSPV